MREGGCSLVRSALTNQSRNLAARAGRWSATHRRIAIVGWFAFVILALMVGSAIGVEEIQDEDSGVGEAREADRAVADAFPENSAETVLVQSRGGVTADQPEFRAVVDDVVRELESTDDVVDVESPYSAGTAGGISQDGTSALVAFEIPDPGDDADVTVEDLVEAPLATVDRLGEAHPEFRIEEFGDASANKALSESFEEDFQKAEVTSLPITLIILLLAFGAVVAGLIPVGLAFAAVLGAIGIFALISQVFPAAEFVNSVILMIGMAVGVDYSLFYLQRERQERRRGADPHHALLTGQNAAFEILLPLATNLDQPAVDGRNLLAMACDTGDTRSIEAVLRRAPANLEWTPRTSRTLVSATGRRYAFARNDRNSRSASCRGAADSTS